MSKEPETESESKVPESDSKVPEVSFFIQLIHDPIIRGWIERLVIIVLAGYFGLKIDTLHTDVQNTKDAATETKQLAKETNNTQKAVAEGTKELVINQIGTENKAVKELAASSQPSSLATSQK